MTPRLWMPDALVHDIGDHAPCEQDKPAKAIAHITWDKNGTKTAPKPLVSFDALLRYFTGAAKGLAPHLLWDPFTGRIAQFVPANSRSKSLRDLPGGVRTNRAGKAVIQIEALFFPYCQFGGKSYAKLTDTPCKNWDKIQDWTHSWGVDNKWPGGQPAGYVRDTVFDFANQGGWFGHNQVPENTHQDPGFWPDFIITDKPPVNPPVNKPPVESTKIPAFPGSQFFRVGKINNHVIEVDHQLIRLKFTKHHAGKSYTPGPYYSENTRLNVQDFQKSRGWTASGADGLVGPKTWHDLHAL